jgi:ribonuclease HII
MLCGVDEAGKGAVIGPLVVAAVGCRRKRDLADLGVRDSKALSPSRREELAAAIRENGFPVAVLVVPAGDIDAGRGFSTMNTIVARSHARVINDLRPHIAVVDACDVIAARYGKAVSEHLDFPCRVVSRHHADEDHPAVSAASIVAKVERDRAVAALSAEFGDMGSGYPSDQATTEFLWAWIRDRGRPPPFARRSWETVRVLVSRREQSHLGDF